MMRLFRYGGRRSGGTILGVPGLALAWWLERIMISLKLPIWRCSQYARSGGRTAGGDTTQHQHSSGRIKGVLVTRQGIKNARPVITEHIDPRGSPISGLAKSTSFKFGRRTDYNAIDGAMSGHAA